MFRERSHFQAYFRPKTEPVGGCNVSGLRCINMCRGYTAEGNPAIELVAR